MQSKACKNEGGELAPEGKDIFHISLLRKTCRRNGGLLLLQEPAPHSTVNYEARASTAASCRMAALLSEVSRSRLGRKQVQVKGKASVTPLTLHSKCEIKKI